MAERRCGELLADMELAKGGGTGANQHNKEKEQPVTQENRLQNPPTLAEMGLTKKQSSSIQKGWSFLR